MWGWKLSPKTCDLGAPGPFNTYSRLKRFPLYFGTQANDRDAKQAYHKNHNMANAQRALRKFSRQGYSNGQGCRNLLKRAKPNQIEWRKRQMLCYF